MADGVAVYWARHVASFSGSTDCEVHGPRGRGWHSNFVDFHGLREIGCWAYEVDGKGQDAVNPQFGITAGNSSWHAGSFECGVQGGEITDLMGPGSAGLNIVGPVDGLLVEDVTFRRCQRGIMAENQQGSPDLTAGRVTINAMFDRCTTAALIDLNKYGGTSRPFDFLDLTGSRFYECINGLAIDNLEDLAADIVFRTSVHAAGGYLFDLSDDNFRLPHRPLVGTARSPASQPGQLATSKTTRSAIRPARRTSSTTRPTIPAAAATPLAGCRRAMCRFARPRSPRSRSSHWQG